eukprot:XP_017452382.1 PREDICTED: uncharacterized protein LOC108351990 [Rattus norvegicus]
MIMSGSGDDEGGALMAGKNGPRFGRLGGEAAITVLCKSASHFPLCIGSSKYLKTDRLQNTKEVGFLSSRSPEGSALKEHQDWFETRIAYLTLSVELYWRAHRFWCAKWCSRRTSTWHQCEPSHVNILWRWYPLESPLRYTVRRVTLGVALMGVGFVKVERCQLQGWRRHLSLDSCWRQGAMLSCCCWGDWRQGEERGHGAPSKVLAAGYCHLIIMTPSQASLEGPERDVSD